MSNRRAIEARDSPDEENVVRPAIYVDMDDVLCETTREIVRLAKAMFGRAIRYDQLLAFDLAESLSLDREQHELLLRTVESDDTIGRYAPTPGSVRCLESWSGKGYRISVVTGRQPDTAVATRRWLGLHGVPYDDLLFVDKYGRHAGKRARP